MTEHALQWRDVQRTRDEAGNGSAPNRELATIARPKGRG
jgi:hypothetical protein